MEGNKIEDQRQHLIDTIDMLLDSGISVYDINVINKNAIKNNYILKSTVKNRVDRTKMYAPEYCAEVVCVEDIEFILED